MKMLKLSVFLLIAVLSESVVFGLNCYQCNSIENSACTHLEDHGEIIQPTPCNNVSEFREVEKLEVTQVSCRKTTLSYLDFDRNQHKRIVRECAYSAFNQGCYVATNDDHEEYVCQCNEDGCNSSKWNEPSIYSMIIFVVLSLFYYGNTV